MGQPIYKVEIHPPGTTFPRRRRAPRDVLTYRNDDGGPGFSKDSRLTFDPPADGTYLVRVEDVRGLGGDAVRLSPGRPAPPARFRLCAGHREPERPPRRDDAGDGQHHAARRVRRPGRRDGRGAPARRDRDPGPDRGGRPSPPILALSADATAPAFSPPTWRVDRAARLGSASIAEADLAHDVDPGGPDGGLDHA